ncbi:hypothetical protein [Maribacter antarcticus]|uniref:hypothetical protein n=1 Tax=Maribacter antarcticus TaxID=505250 RepID=UPI00047BFA81|nr:hypothetical protein [Maribacter antarcticus]
MKHFIFGLLSLLSFSSQAQATGQIMSYGSAGGSANSLGQLETLMGPIAERSSKSADMLEGLSGSPYTSNEFKQGTVYYKEENTGKVYFRYNSYNEEIEIKKTNLKDEPLKSLGRDKNITIVNTNNKALRFSTFIDRKGLTQNGYLTLLVDGDYALYLRNTAKFTEGQKSPNSFVKATPAKFSQYEEYYLEIKGISRVDEIEFKTKKFLKLLPEEVQISAATYLKQEDIKIKELVDVKKLISYLNSKS